MATWDDFQDVIESWTTDPYGVSEGRVPWLGSAGISMGFGGGIRSRFLPTLPVIRRVDPPPAPGLADAVRGAVTGETSPPATGQPDITGSAGPSSFVASGPPTIPGAPAGERGRRMIDLGNIIRDVGTAYVSARYGNTSPRTPGIIPAAARADRDMRTSLFGLFDSDDEDAQAEATVAVTGQAPKGYVWDPRANCGNGKWVKRRRRRRRRVPATQSQIASILALKAAGIKGQELMAILARGGL